MSFFVTRHLCALAALALLVVAPFAKAQGIFLPNDITLDATNPIVPPSPAITGYANFDDYINGVNRTSPTISIVTGADVWELQVNNSSIINMSGGSVGSGDFFGRLRPFDTSTVNISGGTVVIDLDVQNASTVNFSGGTIGDDIISHDDTTINMSGGFVSQDLLINGNSTFNLSGGMVGNDVFVQDSSLLNVFGTGLSSDLIDPNFEGFYSEYTLSGSLHDNTLLAARIIFVQNGSGARFTLNNSASAVPEPGVVALLIGTAFGGGSLLLRRNRQNLR